jgi:hypothetical protein
VYTPCRRRIGIATHAPAPVPSSWLRSCLKVLHEQLGPIRRVGVYERLSAVSMRVAAATSCFAEVTRLVWQRC